MMTNTLSRVGRGRFAPAAMLAAVLASHVVAQPACDLCDTDGDGLPDYVGIPGGQPGDCVTDDFHSRCHGRVINAVCEQENPPASDCEDFASWISGQPLHTDLMFALTPGDYPPRRRDIHTGSGPVAPGLGGIASAPAAWSQRPMLGEVDLITGTPLLQSIDFELGFGSSTFRHVRTYGEEPAWGRERIAAGCTHNHFMQESDVFWDWQGTGWMMGENPLFLIDAAAVDHVFPTATRACYLIPDAHRAIPFFLVDGDYLSPPRFDAVMTHNGGAWDPANNDWASEADRPTEFNIWLEHRTLKYSFTAVYEDMRTSWGQSGGFRSGHDAPDPAGLPNYDYGGGHGIPYYGLLTGIEDQRGTRVEFEYTKPWLADCPNQNVTSCLLCCQNCQTKGQLRQIRLMSKGDSNDPSDPSIPEGYRIDWTILYVYREFLYEADSAVTPPYLQNFVHSIYAYEGPLIGFDLDMPISSGLTNYNEWNGLSLRAEDLPQYDPLVHFLGNDAGRLAALAEVDGFDAAAHFSLPQTWTYRAQYLHHDAESELLGGGSSPYVVHRAISTDTGLENEPARLLKATVTQRVDPATVGTPDDTLVRRHWLYRYRSSVDPEHRGKDAGVMRAVFDPMSVGRMRIALEEERTGSYLLDDWPLGLLVLADEAPVPVDDGQGGPGSSYEQVEFIQSGDAVLSRFDGGTGNDDFGKWDRFVEDEPRADLGPAFRAEMASDFIQLPFDRLSTLSDGVHVYADRTESGAGRYFALYRFALLPAGGGHSVGLLGASETDAPYRAIYRHPYLFAGDLPEINNVNVPTGPTGGIPNPTGDNDYSLDDPFWVVVIDEYDDYEKLRLGATTTFAQELAWLSENQRPLSRRLVQVNVAGHVLKDRTWTIDGDGMGTLSADSGLAEQYIYDEHGRLIENRTVNWSAAEVDPAHVPETEGLIYHFVYDDPDREPDETDEAYAQRLSTSFGAVGLAEGTTGPINWMRQWIRDDVRPDLVTHAIEFVQPTLTLFDFDAPPDHLSPAPNVTIRYAERTFETADGYGDPDLQSPGVDQRVLSERTVMPPVARTPGGVPYFPVRHTRYEYADTGGVQIWRGRGALVDPSTGEYGPDGEFFVDYVQIDPLGRPVLEVNDLDTGATTYRFSSRVKPSVATLVSDPPADMPRRHASAPALNYWAYHLYNSMGERSVELHDGTVRFTKYMKSPSDLEAIVERRYRATYCDGPDDDDCDSTVAFAQPGGELTEWRVPARKSTRQVVWDEVEREFLNGQPSGYEDYDEILSVRPGYDSSGRLVSLDVSGRDGKQTGASVQIANLGSIARERHPDGTIVRHQTDAIGQRLRTFRGTTDEHPHWGTLPPGSQDIDDDMILTERHWYGRSPNDVRRVTQSRRYRDEIFRTSDYVGGATPAEGSTGLVTHYGYDWRGRQVWMQQLDEAGDPLRHELMYYDNLDRLRFRAVYGPVAPAGGAADPRELDNVSTLASVQQILAGSPRRLEETVYDGSSRVSQHRRYDVSDATGSTWLVTRTWFDHEGRVLEMHSPDAPVTRYRYDAFGREIASSQYAGAWELQRVETQYDASGNAIVTTSRSRLHNATSTDPLDATSSVASHIFNWFDENNLLVATADLGTNAPTYQNGPVPVRPVQAPIWTKGTTDTDPSLDRQGLPDHALITNYFYDNRSRRNAVVNARGVRTSELFDSLGKIQVRTENSWANDQRQWRQTIYGYEHGRLVRIGHVLESSNGFFAPEESNDPSIPPEEIRWEEDGFFATTLFDHVAEVVDAGGSVVSTNRAQPGRGHFPDPVDGVPASTPDLIWRYYADGSLAGRTDARGISFTYRYDALSNLSEILVDQDQSNALLYNVVPDLVERVEFMHDPATGQLTDAVAWTVDDAGTEQVLASNRFEYDSFGNLLREYQQHRGLVDPFASPSVDYEWDLRSASAGGLNRNRLDAMVYPVRPQDGSRRRLIYGYGTGDGSKDSLAGNITRITDVALGPIAAYEYAGSSMRVTTTLGGGSGSSVYALRQLFGGPGVSGYPGLDSFGRTIDLHHVDSLGLTAQRREYGYDESGNRAWQRVTQVDGLGGLLENERSSVFAYDSLDRLIGADMGRIVDPGDGSRVAVPSTEVPVVRRESWVLDLLGTWEQHIIRADHDGNGVDDDLPRVGEQTVDLRNELTGLAFPTDAPPGTLPTVPQDASGNLISDGRAVYHYDAWSRLVQISDPGTLVFDADGEIVTGEIGPVVAQYVYDGLGRLISRRSPWDGDGVLVRKESYFYDGARRIMEWFVDPVEVGDPGGGGGPAVSDAIGSVVAFSGSLSSGADGGSNHPSPPGSVLFADREYVYHDGYVDSFACQIDRHGTAAFFVADANHDIIGSTDTAGQVLSQFTYGPNGDVLASDVAAMWPDRQRAGFQGLIADVPAGAARDQVLTDGAAPLYHNRNRVGHSQLGRFVQGDPNALGQSLLEGPASMGRAVVVSNLDIALDRHFGDGLNSHVQLRSNPVRFNDPLGLFVGFVGPTATTEIYTDYNETILDVGGGLRGHLEASLGSIGWDQLTSAEAVGDWDLGDSFRATFAVLTISVKRKYTDTAHVIPTFLLERSACNSVPPEAHETQIEPRTFSSQKLRFFNGLLGIDRAANKLELPIREHEKYHRMLHEEFAAHGLDSPNSRRDRNWRRRLTTDPGVKTEEVNRVRRALMNTARRFDEETDGRYHLRFRTRLGLNAGHYKQGVLDVGRRRRRGR